MSEPIEITVGRPYVEITRMWRGFYLVSLHEGLEWASDRHAAWHVLTLRWAKNKARRALAFEQRRIAAEYDRWIIE